MRLSIDDLPYLLWTQEPPQSDGIYLMLEHPMPKKHRKSWIEKTPDREHVVYCGSVVTEPNLSNIDYWIKHGFKWLCADGALRKWDYDFDGEPVFRAHHTRETGKLLKAHPLWFAKLTNFPKRPADEQKPRTKLRARKAPAKRKVLLARKDQ